MQGTDERVLAALHIHTFTAVLCAGMLVVVRDATASGGAVNRYVQFYVADHTLHGCLCDGCALHSALLALSLWCLLYVTTIFSGTAERMCKRLVVQWRLWEHKQRPQKRRMANFFIV